jgi:hypothetical protein
MATADDMRRRRADPVYRQRENERQLERKHALAIENDALRRQVDALTRWPLLEGFRAAREGRAFDRSKCVDWQSGFWRFKRGQRK